MFQTREASFVAAAIEAMSMLKLELELFFNQIIFNAFKGDLVSMACTRGRMVQFIIGIGNININ